MNNEELIKNVIRFKGHNLQQVYMESIQIGELRNINYICLKI